jgi:hypothetical protein
VQTGLTSHVRQGTGLVLLVVGAILFAPIGRAQDDLSALTKPERLVLANAVLGRPTVFPKVSDDKERTIQSSFVEDLLTGHYGHYKKVKIKGSYQDVKLNRRGFIINNAIFTGSLNLRSVTVPVEMQWIHCQFRDTVDFSSAHFSGPLNLSESSFAKATYFNSIKADDYFAFLKATFDDTVEFYHIDIQRDLFASEANFADKNATIQFGQAVVSGKMFVGAATIENVDYKPATFNGSVSFADTKTLGLNLSGVTIIGKLDLSHANIQTVFDLNRLKCSDPNQQASTQRTCLPSKVALEGLTYADLGGNTVGSLLLDLIGQAPYSAESYTQLEGYYRTHAEPRLADTVFFDMKSESESAFHFCPVCGVGFCICSSVMDAGRKTPWSPV